jgi:hypothetical protein
MKENHPVSDGIERKSGPCLTVEEAVRLKDSINKSITYGPGLNAGQVEALKTLSEQWASVRRDYDEWAKRTRGRNFVLLIIGLACLYACDHYLAWKGWIGWAALIAGIIAVCVFGALFRREGHRDGYVDGYEAGFSDGIDRAYGIDEKEAMDIHNRAIDMQLDEGIIKSFDIKRQPQNR